ncbi:MAG: hypothetical protein HW391_1061 [Chloroflexi bacterium]|nr:hypothetical protein [Chloroflexota bacterium]
MTSEITATASQPVDAASSSRPYAPSWVNLLTSWIEALPGPAWVAYGVAMTGGVLLSAWSAIAVAAELSLAVGGALYYGALPFAVIALIHSLDRTASSALGVLRPVLAMDDAEISETHHQMTVAPARPAMIVTLIAAIVGPVTYALDPIGSQIVGYGPVTLFFRWAWESLITAVFLILIYHSFRQLRLISRIHERVGRIDVFDQAPLYAMSRVTSSTAVGLLLLLVPSLFLFPAEAGVSYLVITAGWYGFAVIVCGAAFALPMRGMHDRLVAEKRRLQGEIGRRITSTLEAVQVAVDAGDVAAIEARNRALATLVASRDVVNRVPTWPWSTGALTGFASAIVLPIVLFLVQRVLSQLV